MPFKPISGTNLFKSPSGRKFTLKQVRLYMANNGFPKRKPRSPRKRK